MYTPRLLDLTCCIFAGGNASRLFPHTISALNQKPLLIMGSPKRRLIDYALDLGSRAEHTLVVTSNIPERALSIERYVCERPHLKVIRDTAMSYAFIDLDSII